MHWYTSAVALVLQKPHLKKAKAQSLFQQHTVMCNLLELDNSKFQNYIRIDLDVSFKASFC